MIDLMSNSQILLRNAGFTVRLSSAGHRPAVCFEDNALVGFCSSFEQTDELLKG